MLLKSHTDLDPLNKTKAQITQEPQWSHIKACDAKTRLSGLVGAGGASLPDLSVVTHRVSRPTTKVS